MRDQLRNAIGLDLSAFAGAHATGELPVPDTAINQLIAERLAAGDTPVESVIVESRPGRAFAVRVRPRTGWIPIVTVEAAIVEQPKLPQSPVLVLRWSLTGFGFLTRLAGPVLGLLHMLPPGIRVEGEHAEVDLAELLRARGHDDLLPLLEQLEVTTGDGRMVVRFAIRV